MSGWDLPAEGIFVTGTGTGVGKTAVTAAICLCTGAEPIKPAQTGSLDPLDLAFVWRATGRAGDPEQTCLYRFAEPLAPAVAARRAGQAIDLERIEACVREAAARGPVIVEGAGGILVEVAAGVSMADLARRLGLPVLVVARAGLGTLNHTALTVEAARARGVQVLGIVVSDYPAEPGLAERTNPRELSRLAPLLGVVPHVEGLDVDAGEPGDLARVARESLAPALGGTFDPDAFLASLA